MKKSPLHQQVETLPNLVREMHNDLKQRANHAFPRELCRQIGRVYITGCGDSHHAALNMELAFEQLAGLPCEPQTAMQFSRYAAEFIPNAANKINLLIGVSVSGQASRTIEAVDLGRQAGATTVAITGNLQAPLAQVAEITFETAVPPLPDELAGLIVPGTRSYLASQLALLILALHLGQMRDHLTESTANKLRFELFGMADLMEETIIKCDTATHEAAQSWQDEKGFVFCGSGPNYGTASFSAAKLLEASGDEAMAQDMEEWAHLQYFARHKSTPTIIISAADRDMDRALEIATAAHRIGRFVAIIAPSNSQLAKTNDKKFLFPISGTPRECFSPLVSFLPAVLFASHRSQILASPISGTLAVVAAQLAVVAYLVLEIATALLISELTSQ